LRQNCASFLAVQGIPDHEISGLLRHSDARLALIKYIRAYDNGRRRVAERLQVAAPAAPPRADTWTVLPQ